MSIFRAMGMTQTIRMAVGLAAALVFALPGHAQDVQVVGKFEQWTAYSYGTGSGRVCFISSKPEKSTISRQGAKRGEIFFLVTHRPGDKTRNVAQAMLGYPLKLNETVTLSIDATNFDLFADQEDAFAGTQAEDRRIINAMKKGSKMVVAGQSQRGTKTSDTYSLAGVTAAMDKIDSLCQ